MKFELVISDKSIFLSTIELNVGRMSFAIKTDIPSAIIANSTVSNKNWKNRDMFMLPLIFLMAISLLRVEDFAAVKLM